MEPEEMCYSHYDKDLLHVRYFRSIHEELWKNFDTEKLPMPLFCQAGRWHIHWYILNGYSFTTSKSVRNSRLKLSSVEIEKYYRGVKSNGLNCIPSFTCFKSHIWHTQTASIRLYISHLCPFVSHLLSNSTWSLRQYKVLVFYLIKDNHSLYIPQSIAYLSPFMIQAISFSENLHCLSSLNKSGI